MEARKGIGNEQNKFFGKHPFKNSNVSLNFAKTKYRVYSSKYLMYSLFLRGHLKFKLLSHLYRYDISGT